MDPKQGQATPKETLRKQLLDPSEYKTEREHEARRWILELQQQLGVSSEILEDMTFKGPEDYEKMRTAAEHIDEIRKFLIAHLDIITPATFVKDAVPEAIGNLRRMVSEYRQYCSYLYDLARDTDGVIIDKEEPMVFEEFKAKKLTDGGGV